MAGKKKSPDTPEDKVETGAKAPSLPSEDKPATADTIEASAATPADPTPPVELEEPGRSGDDAIEAPVSAGIDPVATEEPGALSPADDSDTATTEAAETPETPVEPDPVMMPEPEPEPEAQPQPEPTPVAPPPPAPQRSGVGGMVLGGILAAAIGFGAAYGLGYLSMGSSDEVTLRLDQQDQAIADLRGDLPPATDLAPLTGRADQAEATLADISDRLQALETQVVDLSARMTEIEKAPLTEGVSDAAIQAYEGELARLQATVSEQREEFEAMIARAQQMEANATAQTAESQARAALARILSALDAGSGYAEPLEELTATGTEVPAALSDHAEGVATLSDLQADFPEAARDALAVTRGAGNGSVGDFFKTQLGIRSLEPRAGDDPDAVLSRAEAALTRGDLATTLAELDTLPDPAQAELAAWRDRAQARLTTTQAANGLMADLNSN